MQSVIIKGVKIASSGTGKRGDWDLVVVTGDDGAEFSSFDTALTKLGNDSVIEIEPEVAVVKGKNKVNIKSWKLIREMPQGESVSPKLPLPEPKTQMSKEDWREKDKIERRSIERQVSGKIAAEIIAKPATLKDWRDAAEYVFQWISGEPLQAPVPHEKPVHLVNVGEAIPKATPPARSKAHNPESILTAHELQLACHEDFNMQPKDILDYFKIKSWAELKKSFEGAYRDIQATRPD